MTIFKIGKIRVKTIIRIFVLNIIYSLNYQSYAQSCQCKTQFEFVYSHIETNNPAY